MVTIAFLVLVSLPDVPFLQLEDDFDFWDGFLLLLGHQPPQVVLADEGLDEARHVFDAAGVVHHVQVANTGKHLVMNRLNKGGK